VADGSFSKQMTLNVDVDLSKVNSDATDAKFNGNHAERE